MADVENQGGDSGAENEPNCPWWLKWGAKILGRFQKFLDNFLHVNGQQELLIGGNYG